MKTRFTVLLLVLLCSVLLGVGVHSEAQPSSAGRSILTLKLDSPISVASDDMLRTALQRAVDENAALVVIQLNTPGGLITSMQSMVQRLLDAPVPVAVYVSPSGGSATSAGVFITLAAHFAAMAPGTTIGAAHPVLGDGSDLQNDMRLKVENFALSLITAIAEQRNRNVDWAKRAVRESVSITDREAVQEKVVDIVATDLKELITQLENRTVAVKGAPRTLTDIRSLPVVAIEPTFKQSVLRVLADPNVTLLLGLGAMIGISLELYSPGLILPGVVGVLCLLLSMASAQVLPVTEIGALLVGVSVLFFVLEAFVPSFGIWGGAGIVSLTLGGLYLVDDNAVWGYRLFEVNPWLVGCAAGSALLALVVLSRLSLRIRKQRVTTGSEGLLDSEASVQEPFQQTADGAVGKVSVRGELWNARLQEGDTPPAVGTSVRVLAREGGLRLVVTTKSSTKFAN